MSRAHAETRDEVIAEAEAPEMPDLEQIHDAMTTATRANPHLAVAAAFGVGAVLGGGIPTWALRLAAGAAIRIATARVLAPTPAPE